MHPNKSILDIAAQRMLTLEDAGLCANSKPDVVKSKCDEIAKELAERYLDEEIDWASADTIATHIFNLMLQHCGTRLPDYAWEIYLAFDEAEASGGGDEHTRPRVAELVRKYSAG